MHPKGFDTYYRVWSVPCSVDKYLMVHWVCNTSFYVGTIMISDIKLSCRQILFVATVEII